MDLMASQLKKSYLIKSIIYTQDLLLFPKMISNFWDHFNFQTNNVGVTNNYKVCKSMIIYFTLGKLLKHNICEFYENWHSSIC